MKVLGTDIKPLGMGCWPIGGPMFSGDQSLGYSNTNDAESIRTIHAALDGGIRLFDTAAVYGAGHAERLLAKALKGRHDVLVVTKIGIAIDEKTKQLTGDETDPATVIPAIERCLQRLERDTIDILLFHQNEFPSEKAALLFDEMEKARKAGKIRAFGWSTDFSANVRAMAGREGFVAVEYAMNVLYDAPGIGQTARETNLYSLIRSPLAMGLLTGKYDADEVLPATDIRATGNPATAYFQNARANPLFLRRLEAVRDLLITDGRSQTQGALCWLWAKSDENIPIPGARTVTQIEEIVRAIDYGPLPHDAMAQIEILIDREPVEAKERAR